MGTCEVCGNHYKNNFKVTLNNATHEFDCFECAIHRLAPVCASCSCRIIGQGVEEDGIMYCGTHCQRVSGRHLYLGDITDQMP
jgi:hypothetical protein